MKLRALIISTFHIPDPDVEHRFAPLLYCPTTEKRLCDSVNRIGGWGGEMKSILGRTSGQVNFAVPRQKPLLCTKLDQ